MNTKTIIFIIIFVFSPNLMAFFLGKKSQSQEKLDIKQNQILLALIAQLSCRKICENEDQTDEQNIRCRNFCLAQQRLVIKKLLHQSPEELSKLIREFKDSYKNSSDVEKLYRFSNKNE